MVYLVQWLIGALAVLLRLSELVVFSNFNRVRFAHGLVCRAAVGLDYVVFSSRILLEGLHRILVLEDADDIHTLLLLSRFGREHVGSQLRSLGGDQPLHWLGVTFQNFSGDLLELAR